MSLAKQLYQLQEVDLEIESTKQALKKIISQIGENEAIARAQSKLAMEQQQLEELERQQRSVEWEIDDVATKLAAAEEQLYSGRIKNPKELANLQHETDNLRTRRNKLEDKALEIMDQAELATKNIAAQNREIEALDAEWQSQQKELSARQEQLNITLSNLNQKRQLLAAEIDPQTLGIYQEIKKQKGRAVAKVEQGICRGCRISLPVNELQRTKSGNLVQCSSCGRILFLA